jgi:hypothetical protein
LIAIKELIDQTALMAANWVAGLLNALSLEYLEDATHQYPLHRGSTFRS